MQKKYYGNVTGGTIMLNKRKNIYSSFFFKYDNAIYTHVMKYTMK